jgi:hypothetical protein
VHEPVYFNKSSFKKMSHKYNVEEMWEFCIIFFGMEVRLIHWFFLPSSLLVCNLIFSQPSKH